LLGHRHRNLGFTSFPELSIAVVTHFGHSIFEVLQRISVSGTSSAHHLLTEKKIVNWLYAISSSGVSSMKAALKALERGTD